MMSTCRNKVVIAIVVLFSAAAVIAFAGWPIRHAMYFALLPRSEKNVVGEWKTNAMGGEVVTIIRADHTYTTHGGCLEGVFHGRWSVDGSDIAYYSTDRPPVEASGDSVLFRMPIQKLIDLDREERIFQARDASGLR